MEFCSFNSASSTDDSGNALGNDARSIGAPSTGAYEAASSSAPCFDVGNALFAFLGGASIDVGSTTGDAGKLVHLVCWE